MEFPLVRNLSDDPESLEDIGTGRNELVLKCVDGLFKGRFIYKEGEVFGSGDPDTVSITTYIEKAGLSERHARILHDPDSGDYFLTDLNSESGTWIKVQTTLLPGEPVMEGSIFKIAGIEFHVKYGEEDTVMNRWIERYDLLDIEADLRHIKTKQDLTELDLQSLTSSSSMIEKLEMAIKEILTLPDTIRTLIFESSGMRFEVNWKEITIGSKETCDVVLPNLNAFQIKIMLINNQFYISSQSSTHFEVYRKLLQNENFNLVPGLSFRIGKLEFDVCKFNVGRCSEKGIRPKMEDTDCIYHNLWFMQEIPISYYAVYDGHGGNQCSNFLKENLHKIFRCKWLENTQRTSNIPLALKQSLESAFMECDEMYYRQDPETAKYVGSAAVVSMIMGDRIIVSNLGDSKAILCRKGRAIELTSDHKPDCIEEQLRIEKRGGFVVFGRLFGRLAVSRAFGDFEFKYINPNELGIKAPSGPLIISQPDITQIFIDPNQDEFLLIACDGLFEAYSPQEVVTIIREKLCRMPITEQDPQRIIREVVNSAIYERKTRDNVTAILVTLSCGIQI